MAVTRARKTEIQLRRKQIAELYVQGWTQMAIDEKLNIGQPTVSLDLQKLQKEWRESRIRDFDTVRELEIQKLDRLEREAWLAWERSQKPSQSAEFKDDATNTPSKKKVKNQNGDPRFLVVVHQCIASRRALLGLDALPALPKEDANAATDSAERADRIISLVTSIRDRERAAGAGTIIIAKQSGDVRADGEWSKVEDGSPPGLPGPSDHRVD